MQARELRSSFTSGELDPRLHGRADLRDVAQGAKNLENWALLVQGGIRRRWGSRFVIDLGADGRLEEYIFSEGQEYCLYFKNAALAIYDSNGTACTVSGSVSWTLAQVWDIDFAYFGDTIILTHKSVALYKVVRTGATTFTVSALAFETTSSGVVRQPYYKYAADSVTLTAGATTGSGVNFTASSAAFSSSHVGTKIRYKKKQISVTGYTSSTVVVGTIDETLPSTTADTDWDEQAYSAVHGYPIAVTFHENRLWLGGSSDAPTILAGSKLGAYFNNDVGTGLDTEAIFTRISFDRMGGIKYITSGRHLLIHAEGAEIYAPNPADKILTPSNITFKRQTPYGSTNVKVRMLEDSAVFIQRTRSAVRETLYDYLQSSYTGNAISLRSSHLLIGPKQLAVVHGTSAGPEQYAFLLQSDGSIAVMSAVRSEKLSGWVPWRLNDGDLFNSIACTTSNLWFVAKRVIGGVTKYYLEKADPNLAMDCAKAYAISATQSVFTGLSHINGRTSHVLVDSYDYRGEHDVTDNQVYVQEGVTVTSGTKNVYVGLKFDSVLESLPPTVVDAEGSTFHEIRRVSGVDIQVSSAFSFTVQGDRFFPHQVGDDMSLPLEPTNSVIGFANLGYSQAPSISALVDIPMPMEIRAITYTVSY